MLLEYKFKNAYTKSELDKLLDEGWFRSTELMVKAQLMCLDEQISAIINIRLPIKNYSLKKKYRKIIRKVENKSMMFCALTLGLFILGLLRLIPYLRFFVTVAIILLGIGAIIVSEKKQRAMPEGFGLSSQ